MGAETAENSRKPVFGVSVVGGKGILQRSLHMDWDRCHEDYVYDGWFSKAMDFGYLIPDELCYWKIEGRDYWKFRQL